MKPLLLALQFHVTDYEAAMSLVELICDTMEPGQEQFADFMFAASARADLDRHIVREAARRFRQVHTFRCTKDINGWPAGPNNQAFEVAHHFASMCLSGRWEYAGMLLAEPDCVPLRRDWIELLTREWHDGPPTCLGPWVTCGPAPYNQHINGNSIFGPHWIATHKQAFRAPSPIGWDAFNAGMIMSSGRASRWIFSDYVLGTERNPWRGCDDLFKPREILAPHPLARNGPQSPAWLHGPKCWKEAHACVRERLSL